MIKPNHFLFLMILFILFAGCSLIDEQAELSEGINPDVDKTIVDNVLTDTNEAEVLKREDKKNQSVHFDSNFKLWSDFEIPPGTNIKLSLNGSGVATHMGYTKLVIDEVVTVDQLQNIWEATASVIATAANGDELHFSYECAIDVSETPDFLFTGTGAVTGGTGKFENAQGNLEINKRFNWFTLDGTVSFKGELSY